MCLRRVFYAGFGRVSTRLSRDESDVAEDVQDLPADFHGSPEVFLLLIPGSIRYFGVFVGERYPRLGAGDDRTVLIGIRACHHGDERGAGWERIFEALGMAGQFRDAGAHRNAIARIGEIRLVLCFGDPESEGPHGTDGIRMKSRGFGTAGAGLNVRDLVGGSRGMGPDLCHLAPARIVGADEIQANGFFALALLADLLRQGIQDTQAGFRDAVGIFRELVDELVENRV